MQCSTNRTFATFSFICRSIPETQGDTEGGTLQPDTLQWSPSPIKGTRFSRNRIESDSSDSPSPPIVKAQTDDVQRPKRYGRWKKYTGIGAPANTVTTQISSTSREQDTISSTISTQSGSTSTQPGSSSTVSTQSTSRSTQPSTCSSVSPQSGSTSVQSNSGESDVESLTRYSQNISLAPVSQFDSNVRTPTPESRSSRLDITDAAETMQEILSLYVFTTV